MTVVRKENSAVCIVESDNEKDVRALQLATTQPTAGDTYRKIYANEHLEVGDLVLVCKVDQFLFQPPTEMEDLISDIILGIVPPSDVQEYNPTLVGD